MSLWGEKPTPQWLPKCCLHNRPGVPKCMIGNPETGTPQSDMSGSAAIGWAPLTCFRAHRTGQSKFTWRCTVCVSNMHRLCKQRQTSIALWRCLHSRCMLLTQTVQPPFRIRLARIINFSGHRFGPFGKFKRASVAGLVPRLAPGRLCKQHFRSRPAGRRFSLKYACPLPHGLARN